MNPDNPKGISKLRFRAKLRGVMESTTYQYSCTNAPMNSKSPSYHGYRFPPEIISHAVWLTTDSV